MCSVVGAMRGLQKVRVLSMGWHTLLLRVAGLAIGRAYKPCARCECGGQRPGVICADFACRVDGEAWVDVLVVGFRPASPMLRAEACLSAG